jgi:hypothetical protein
VPEETVEPRVLGTKKVDRELIPFFVIDDVTYYVPKVVPKNIAVKALEVFRNEGQLAIANWLCVEVLGEDAYEALRDCEDLSDEDITYVFDELSTRALGPLEKALGKRKRGR